MLTNTKKKPVGFITFESREQAKQAIQSLQVSYYKVEFKKNSNYVLIYVIFVEMFIWIDLIN